jgi:hypothetical protein
VLYIHTKGVTGRNGEFPPKDRIKNVKAWRHFLEYMLINKHEECLELLEKVDICGVNWRDRKDKVIPPYFASNFWWANADFISTLPKITKEMTKERSMAEFWIGLGSGVAGSKWRSKVNHYTTEYPPEKYVGKKQPVLYYRFKDRVSELINKGDV